MKCIKAMKGPFSLGSFTGFKFHYIDTICCTMQIIPKGRFQNEFNTCIYNITYVLFFPPKLVYKRWKALCSPSIGSTFYLCMVQVSVGRFKSMPPMIDSSIYIYIWLQREHTRKHLKEIIASISDIPLSNK